MGSFVAAITHRMSRTQSHRRCRFAKKQTGARIRKSRKEGPAVHPRVPPQQVVRRGDATEVLCERLHPRRRLQTAEGPVSWRVQRGSPSKRAVFFMQLHSSVLDGGYREENVNEIMHEQLNLRVANPHVRNAMRMLSTSIEANPPLTEVAVVWSGCRIVVNRPITWCECTECTLSVIMGLAEYGEIAAAISGQVNISGPTCH